MLIEVIIMGLHAPVDAAHPFWGVGDFDISPGLPFQAGGLREVGVE